MTSSRVLNGAIRLLIGATVTALVAYSGVPAAGAASARAVPDSGVAGLSVSLSTSAAGVSGVTYTVSFTASGTGALAAGSGTVTLATPADTQFPAGVVVSGSAAFDDLTSGATASEPYFGNDPVNSGGTLTLTSPIAISAGDQVKVTYDDVTNSVTVGSQTASVSSSSDTQPVTAGFSITTPKAVAAFGGASMSTPAASAQGVTYTFGFTASGTGALVNGLSTITLSGPPTMGFFAAAAVSGNATFDDLTSGKSVTERYFTNDPVNSDGTLTLVVPINIAAGDRVKMTYTDVTNADAAGSQTLTLTTSSDTQPATAQVTLTAAQPVTGFGDLSMSTTAAGASNATYTFEFTASKTGTMLAGDSTITLSGPPTMSFFEGVVISGNATFDDLTSGTSVTERYFTNAPVNSNGTLTLVVPINIAAGDRVKMTYTDVTNGSAAGPQTLTLSTTSDTVAATAPFTLAAPNPVAAPGVAISTQQPGAPATYTITFTASSTGGLVSGDGFITLAAPAGTNFGSASYTLDDITAQQSTAIGGSVTNGGATVTFGAPFTIAAGDQIAITATGVTNPAASGQVAMGISTSSDTATATPGYVIGDSPPVFTQATPPLVVAAGSHPSYRFAVTGYPAPLFSLRNAPAWLSIQGGTGKLGGTVPAGVKSFSFSVTASNSHGTAIEGPYTVTVGESVAVSGKVVNDSGDPVANVIVNACDTSGGVCESATTGDSGAFTVSALAGTRIVVTAYPPPGSGDSTSSTPPLDVPKTGLTGVSITTHAGIPPIAGGLLINGSSSPTVYWASPSVATLTGCPNGLATVSVIGDNIATGELTPNFIVLTETPPGSGDYTGTIPPQEPVHGPVDIRGSIVCPADSPILPDLGPASGGTKVIVAGSGFTGVTSVGFGGTPAASYTVLSADAISAIVPPGHGTVPVTVADASAPGGHQVGTYTYQAVTSVTPAGGATSGATWVLIKGIGLLTASRVMFGSKPAEDYLTLSDTELEALSPPGSGTVDVRVVTSDGATDATPADRFSYGHAAATATSISPPPAPDAGRHPAAAPAGIVGLITNFIYAKGAEIIGDAGLIGQIKRQAEELAANQQRNCVQSRQDAKDQIMTALGPLIGALAKRITPTVVLAEIEFFSLLGLVGFAIGVLIATFTPILLEKLLDHIAEAIVEEELVKYFDGLYGPNCGGEEPSLPPNLPPPLPEPEPAGSDPHCSPESESCGFTPTGLIDPSGTILDTSGRPVSGATVTIFRSFTRDGTYSEVKDTSPGIFPPENPEITGSGGTFHWDVADGFYKVEAFAPGCTVPGTTRTTAVIGPYPVPPPQLGLTITLACKNAPKPPVPVISSLSAHSGRPAGGTVITVLGSGFVPASKVLFGGVRASNVTYLSPQALTVTAPRGSGLVQLHVTNVTGTSKQSAASAFFYGAVPSVTGVSPRSGPADGGTVITITGTGFTSVTGVNIGGLRARSFSVRSATRISVKVPPGQAGTVDVSVANPAGVSTASQRDLFSYLAPVTAYVSNTAGVTAISGAGRVGRLVKVPGARYIAATPSGQMVYVTGTGGVTPISASSGQPGGLIEVGPGLRSIEITPDGQVGYVASYQSGTVTPIHTATDIAARAIKVGRGPDAIAITPNGRLAYVANYLSATITPLRTGRNTALKPIRVGRGPVAIAITPNGAIAYVVDSLAGKVTPIKIATGKAGRPINVGSGPDAIAITPNGATAYVLNYRSGTVSPIKTATGKAGRAIKVGAGPAAIAITPNGRTAYVLNSLSGTVTPIQVASGRTGKTIKVGALPDAIAITPDGTVAYVATYRTGTVSLINARNGTLIKVIKVGAHPFGIAITG